MAATPEPAYAVDVPGLAESKVRDGAGLRGMEAAENGLIGLPECDYRVLKNWEARPYGF